MTDLFGIELNIGDEIIYTTGSQGNTDLERGFILEIKPTMATIQGRANRFEALIKTSSGRKATNWRGSYELVAVKGIAQSYPELFI